MPQTDLSQFAPADHPDSESVPETRSAPDRSSESGGHSQRCPWCLAGAERFRAHADGRVGCGACEAVIPTEAAWFERGETIRYD